MALRGDVETATELAETAAAHDIAHVSARTARNVLHHEGLKADRPSCANQSHLVYRILLYILLINYR
ncbi:hypothetical protein EON65_56710 [archaeon]|nr:MAG: hypothetical protein EON65_56710 [archaeon]